MMKWRRRRKEKRSLCGRNKRRPRCAVIAQPASGELRLPQHLQKQEARLVRTALRQLVEAETQLQRRQQQPSDGGGRGEVKGEPAAGGGGESGRQL